MKHPLTFLAIAAASSLLAQRAFANPTITWDDPKAITSSSQIDTHGKLVHAGYWGTDPVTVTANGEQILFAPRKVADSGTTDGSAGCNGNGTATGGFTGDTGDPNMNKVLTAFVYDGASPRAITLEGLKPGDSYEVQLFAIDDRSDSGEGDRALRYGDKADFSGSTSKTFKDKDNAFVIGHFKADATKVTVYEDISNLGNFTAYVLRDVTK